MLEETEAKNKLGTDLVNEADGLLQEATDAFYNLQDSMDTMGSNIDTFNVRNEETQGGIDANRELLYQANAHSAELDRQAQSFEATLAGYKEPRTLQAAAAYENIAEAIEEARRDAEEAQRASEEAEQIVSRFAFRVHNTLSPLTEHEFNIYTFDLEKV